MENTKELMFQIVKKVFDKNKEDILKSQKEKGIIHLQYNFITNLLLNEETYFKNANHNKLFEKDDINLYNESLETYKKIIDDLDGDMLSTMNFLFNNIQTISV